MNCSPNDSKNLTQCNIVSKYFSGKTAMDESLTDFQEKRKNFTGPKNTQKPKTQTKKPVKRIRGQKDIRTALKSKKSELVAYSTDFEKVCKKSGIDVDPEQLQLAIALSKSLQKTEEDPENSQSSRSLTTSERTGKIRTTLLEYGFVVPEVKITTAKSKKLKRYRKNYKLLLSTQEEKQQVISDRYSKILFSNFDNSKHNSQCEKSPKLTARLYNLGTEITYEELKDRIFYVESLFEKSCYKIGSLLRDWSEIPGRPVSPVCDIPQIEFDKIYCSQEELDCMLSGTLKKTQEIARNKHSLLPKDLNTSQRKTQINGINLENSTATDTKMDTNDVEIVEINFKGPSEDSKLTETIALDEFNPFPVTQNNRSYSPDLFDDEVSTILDNSVHGIDSNVNNFATNVKDQTKLKSQVSPKNTTKRCEETMDLTTAVVNSQRDGEVLMSQLSQGINVTKRRSNDLMDITDCVTGSSQAIREVRVEQNIDLTQNSDENEVVIQSKRVTVLNDTVVESLDLTQSSESNDLPSVQISGTNSLENTIIMNESYTELLKCNTTKELNVKSKPSKEIDETKLMEIVLSNTLNNSEYIIVEEEQDKTPIEETNYERDGSGNTKMNNFEARAINPIGHDSNNLLTEDRINTFSNRHSETQNFAKAKSVSPIERHNNSESKTGRLLEEFFFNHSGSSKEKSDELLCLDESVEVIAEDIDLTQTSESSEDSRDINEKLHPQIMENLSRDRIVRETSIVGDEIFDDMVKSYASSSKSVSNKNNTTESQTKPSSSMSDLVSSSQNSEVFEISDNELDYSLHKSKLDGRDNFDFGGISVVDNLPDLPSFRLSRNSFHRSLSDGCLTEVNLKSKVDVSTIYSPNKTPCKDAIKEVVAKTPKNSEYVIKVDDVTPMMDYEAMSTPEVNAELDKYGLKPFKRKRAIQLLTHLYNQTHPVLKSCSDLDDDLASPSKKLKKSISPKKIAEMFKQKNNTVSRKIVSPKASDVTDKENNIYDVTNDVLIMSDLDCNEEECVLQKKERAKVHYCAVPLHIAFHNYVSSRLRLREAILRYEPVNIDVIHKGLAKNGFRYDPKDLLRFMDRKCITVKTTDNNARNSKKH